MKDILIVLDTMDSLRGISGELGFYSRYFTCLTARNGKTALEMLGTAVIDVVITGTTLPDMDSLTFMQQAMERNAAVTIFTVATSDDREAVSSPGKDAAERMIYRRDAQDLSSLAASIMAS